MNAYDLSNSIKDSWVKNVSLKTNVTSKQLEEIGVIVKCKDGSFGKVIGVTFNEQMKSVELQLESEDEKNS